MEEQQQQNQNPEDKLGVGLTILSFCIPLAGLILYFVKKEKTPAAAKTAITAAAIGFGIGIVLNVISRVMMK
jgi:hypothetical protein